jgi:hypothetical protein
LPRLTTNHGALSEAFFLERTLEDRGLQDGGPERDPRGRYDAELSSDAGTTVFFRDPDGSRLEFSSYTYFRASLSSPAAARCAARTPVGRDTVEDRVDKAGRELAVERLRSSL